MLKGIGTSFQLIMGQDTFSFYNKVVSNRSSSSRRWRSCLWSCQYLRCAGEAGVQTGRPYRWTTSRPGKREIIATLKALGLPANLATQVCFTCEMNLLTSVSVRTLMTWWVPLAGQDAQHPHPIPTPQKLYESYLYSCLFKKWKNKKLKTRHANF